VFVNTGTCVYTLTLSNESNQEQLTTLIFPGMYTNMLLGYEILKFNHDSDEALEYEENDIIEHFKSFYDDVSEEIKKFGKLKQFLVCSNYEPHLRGNVYVQFEREKDALKAYQKLNGRYYAGKQIYCFFTHVKNWYEAICSLFLRKKCNNGSKCKYLHVFQNPYNEFNYQSNLSKANESLTHLSRTYLTNKNTKDTSEMGWNSDEETCSNDWEIQADKRTCKIAKENVHKINDSPSKSSKRRKEYETNKYYKAEYKSGKSDSRRSHSHKRSSRSRSKRRRH